MFHWIDYTHIQFNLSEMFSVKLTAKVAASYIPVPSVTQSRLTINNAKL